VLEFNLKKGIWIAVFSGVMSGCFAWGLAAGQPIRDLTLAAGTANLWQGLPVLCVVLLGGLTTNLLWCSLLIRRNGTFRRVLWQARARRRRRRPAAPAAPQLPARGARRHAVVLPVFLLHDGREPDG
jgi:L-rhamnose-H+ transport protein